MDNKWTMGKVKLRLPPLPPILMTTPGIKPVPLVLDLQIGMEIVLLITEPREQAVEFAGSTQIDFVCKSGLLRTSHGPVFWLVFYFPATRAGQQVAFEYVVNPKDDDQMRVIRMLSGQKYWHVVVADLLGEVVNFFEFENRYDLSGVLGHASDICSRLTVSNFIAAKAEYETSCSIEDLLRE